MRPIRRVTAVFVDCPGRPDFTASVTFGPDQQRVIQDVGLRWLEEHLTSQAVHGKCPVTGQSFRPEQHSHTTIDYWDPAGA